MGVAHCDISAENASVAQCSLVLIASNKNVDVFMKNHQSGYESIGVGVYII